MIKQFGKDDRECEMFSSKGTGKFMGTVVPLHSIIYGKYRELSSLRINRLNEFNYLYYSVCLSVLLCAEKSSGGVA